MNMIERSVIKEYPQIGKTFKYVLSLNSECSGLKWDMFVYKRNSENIEKIENIEDFEKNLKNFQVDSEWEIVINDIPKDAEMVFYRMKISVFDILEEIFSKDLKNYKEIFLTE